MSISVAMATFNGADHIEAQLRSLATQTRLPDEVVICDDRSTDRTVEIVDALRSSLPFEIRLFVNDVTLFPHGNFGRALALCEGNFVFLCDQDDVWHDAKIERVTDAMASGGYQGAFVNIIETDRHLKPKGPCFPLQVTHRDDLRMHVHGCASAYTRAFLELALPLDNLAEKQIWFDQWLAHLAEAMMSRLYIPEPLQLWRRHSTSWTGSDEPAPVARPSFYRRPWGSTESQLKACHWQIAMNNAIVQRLTSSRAEIVGALDLDAIVDRLDHESRALALRCSALETPRLVRMPRVARAYTRGAYRASGASRSALIDLIR